MAIRLVANSYSQNKAKQYRISIREHSNGYSFSIVDLTNSECVALAQYDSFKELMEDPLVKEEYGEVRVVVDNASFALVPEALFVTDNAACYLPVAPQHQKRAVVATTNIAKFSVVGLCNRRGCFEFPNGSDSVSYVHPLFVMLEKVGAQDAMPLYKQMVFAEVQRELIHLLVVDYKKVLLANTFQIKTKEDILYFIIVAYQSLGLDFESVPLSLSGDYESALQDALGDYIRVVAPMSSSRVTMPDEWNEGLSSKFALIL